MSGRARFHAITDLLDKRTREEFEPEPDDPAQPSSLDYVCHWLSSGKTAKSLAASLAEDLPFPLDYAALMRYLKTVYGEKADHEIEQARTNASYALSEEALDIVDAPAETSAEVARAASRARSRQWMAERYNSSKFGQHKHSLTVNIGTLHLDALRAPRHATPATGLQGGNPGTALPFAPARLIEPCHIDTHEGGIGVAECESRGDTTGSVSMAHASG